MLRRWVFAVTFVVLASSHPLQAQVLPPQAQADFEGEIEVQYEDSNTGSRLLHYLKTTNGQRLRLQFARQPQDLLTGQRVRARGTVQNNTLMLSSDGSVQALTPASAYTFGVQPVLVMLINFADNPAQPYSTSLAQSVTFTEARNFYLENSYQQTALTGTVVGWFTIAANSSTCDTNNWATLADAAAANTGIALANYPRRIYGFPSTSACSWWGLGTVGGGSPTSPSRAWVNGTYSLRVVGHELGHNFGDSHSRSWSCDAGTCTASEYGDDRDIMGATTSHLNAFQKERLGWLSYGTSPPIISVTSSGNYSIDAYSQYGTLPKALKVLKAVDANGKRTWYYLESRARTGFDANITAGVTLHTGSEASGNSSYQLDLNPTSTRDTLLEPGQTFTDLAIGLQITTISSDTAGATVSITLDGSGTPTCVRAAPTVTLSSSQTTNVPAGTLVTYTAAVRNNDSSSCTAAAFGLTAGGPSGWTKVLGAPSLTIAPGATATTTLQVTSSATAATGSYSVTAMATNAQDTTKSASGSAGYTVVAPVTSIVVQVSTDRAVYAKNQTIRVTSTVGAGTSMVAGATVVFRVTKSNGSVASATVTTNASGSASYSYRIGPKDPAGVYQISATATYGSATASSAVSVNVNK